VSIQQSFEQPDIFSPGNENIHEGSLISSVSWNTKVAHILASSSENGIFAVWDLKNHVSLFNH